AGGGGHPAHRHRAALAQVDLVEVRREDAGLRVAEVQHPGHGDLADLAPPGALGPEVVEVLHGLHGDGAAALHDVAALHVGEGGTHDGHGIDPPVVVEAHVLGGQHRILQRLGDAG